MAISHSNTHSNTPYKKKPQAGLTLVEVVVALTLLGLLLAAAFSAMNHGFLLNHNAEMRNRANELIDREVEYLRTLPWADVESIEDGNFFQAPMRSELQTERLVATDDPTAPNIVYMKLTVTWTDVNGRSQSVSTLMQCTKGGISAYAN